MAPSSKAMQTSRKINGRALRKFPITICQARISISKLVMYGFPFVPLIAESGYLVNVLALDHLEW